MNYERFKTVRDHFVKSMLVAMIVCSSIHLSLNASAKDEDLGADSYYYFSGADIWALGTADDYRPMIDFRDDTVVLWGGAGTEKVTLESVRDLKFVSSQKLSRNFVRIDDMKVNKVVRQGQNYSKSMMKMMQLQNMADDAQQASMYSVRFGSGTTVSGSSLSGSQLQAKLDTVSGANHAKNKDGLASDTGEPVNVQFRVSAESPIQGAYALIILQVKAAEGDQTQQWIHFARIGDIGTDTKKVDITEMDRPAGFEVQGAKIFIYAHGEEIANSLSGDSRELSVDDARTQVNEYYVSTRGTLSLPPCLATNSISDDMVALLKNAGVSGNVVLRLDADARVKSAKCEGKTVSQAGLALLRELVFHPGLKEGKPAASSVSINIDQFSASSLQKIANQ